MFTFQAWAQVGLERSSAGDTIFILSFFFVIIVVPFITIIIVVNIIMGVVIIGDTLIIIWFECGFDILCSELVLREVKHKTEITAIRCEI